MRLFVAVCFDDTTKSRLLAIQEHIKSQSARGNFSRPENLHLTLVFIGEVDDNLAPVIISIVKNAIPTEHKKIAVNFDKTGCFRHSGKELWWIGCGTILNEMTEAGLAALADIRRKIGEALDAEGIHYDRRPFSAHITLGREIKPISHIVSETINKDQAMNVPITRISLMKSQHINRKLTYTEIFGQNL